jgi:hypothetical protein
MSGFDLDISTVAAEDFRVKLPDDKVWRMPGMPDSEVIARLQALFVAYEEAANSPDEKVIERLAGLKVEIREQFEELFGQRHSEEEMESFPSLGDAELAQLFTGFVDWLNTRAGVTEAPEGGDRPSSSTPRSRSRSRTSGQRSRRRKTATSSTSS